MAIGCAFFGGGHSEGDVAPGAGGGLPLYALGENFKFKSLPSGSVLGCALESKHTYCM